MRDEGGTVVVLGLEETEYMAGTKRMAHVRNEGGGGARL